MNKEEIEKMFDEEFDWLCLLNSDWDNVTYRIKEVFFEEMLPKILKSIIDIRDEDWEKEDWEDYREDFKLWAIEWIERIKQKSKELYNIDL